MYLEILFWIIIIIIAIIAISLIFFFTIKQYALFQATRDEKWHPDTIMCEEHRMMQDTYSGLPTSRSIQNAKYCKDYVDNFENLYLVIGDKKCKGYTRKEITELSNSKVCNLSELQYINIWKWENFPGNRMVLYFHGNNDNISYRKYVIDITNRLKLNLMLVDYRGYGDSSGLPSNLALLEDAKTAYKYINQHYHYNDIIIWGESLGGIAAIWTAHKYKANALVLLSTFADIKTIIDKLDINESLKKMMKKFADGELMNNGEWIKDVDIPTVIIHSPVDDLLPYVNAEMNYANVNVEKKKLINITGPHAHPYFTDKELYELLDFIEIRDPEILDHKNIGEILDIINNI